MKKIEVLAPAGDLIRLKAAVDFGADAVYFGGKEFGMRAAPGNFNLDEIKEGADYAHANGCKAYLTLNTLPRNEEVDRMPEFIKAVAKTGVDAFIIADLGVLDFANEFAPEIEKHISVQTGILNYGTALFYHKLGAKRIVVARELSLEEIKTISEKIPEDLEIEAFVHGAICMSVSGRCLLSNYLNNRDANRGECSQPCRWKYHLVEEKRPNEFMPIFEDEEGSYILNAKDMNMIEHIADLYYAGVTSFKIEGRAKTEYYTAAVTSAYRQAVDGFVESGYDRNYKVDPRILEEVNKVSHRVYSTGFYESVPTSGQVHDNGGYIRDYELIGIVKDYKEGVATILQRNRFYPGTYDVLDSKRGSFDIVVDTLYDENMNQIETANKAGMTVKFYCEELKVGSFLRAKITK